METVELYLWEYKSLRMNDFKKQINPTQSSDWLVYLYICFGRKTNKLFQLDKFNMKQIMVCKILPE